jgi:ubiquinone/menaquinone biosynthesis C-methylase UbiE
MADSFARLQQTWETLGDEDPLWAILSNADKKGGRWELAEFLRTGDEVVDRYWGLLRQHGAPESFDQVLDFGCGVGRLTLAWARHARQVTGVDISAPMIEKGRQIMAGQEALRLELNPHPDLSLFSADSFDLVFSHIVLQHIPWKHSQGYFREFARICKPGGWVAFQLPAGASTSQTLPRLRRWLVEHLPFGLGAAYRRWRHGSSVQFDMHFTKSGTVEALLHDVGLTEVYREPDGSAGPQTEGYLYLYRKGA